MSRDDFPLVSRWLAQPHVQRWWIGEDAEPSAVEQKYGPRIAGTEPTEMFIISGSGQPIGMIQRYRIADYPEWARALAVVSDAGNSAGIDYLIGEPDALNRGFGTEAIRSFVPMVFERWPVDSIIVAVQQANRASWRALERCGFVRAWAGELDSADPSDAGASFVYVQARPA